MSYQTPKKLCIPGYVKDSQDDVSSIGNASVQGNKPAQVVGTPSNWTFLSSDYHRSPHRHARLGNFVAPPCVPRNDMAHQHLRQIVEESGHKSVTIPDLSNAHHWPIQPPLTQGSVQNFTLPIRQPIQPPTALPHSAGGPHPTAETFASDKVYWPMNSIQDMRGHPFAAMCATEPAAIHLGHSDSKHSKPTLVSDDSGGTDVTAANQSAPADEIDAPSKVALGFSPEYHGDPNLWRNRSANIPDSLNCSLFLVNLPPTLTTHRLIAAIHAMGPTGRIYATHINSPEPDRKHYGCAAKVIFFELAAARAFYKACCERGFTVDGFTVRVMWNRIKTAQQDHAKSTTRVLLIGGKPSFVNPTTLTEYFCTKLQFQIDCIITHNDGLKGDTDAVVEYRFGSFRCQAEAAKMALVREHPEVRCFFHSDPCDKDHWAPSKPIPIVRPQPPVVPLASPPVPLKDPAFWARAGLSIVPEEVEDPGLFRPMRASLR